MFFGFEGCGEEGFRYVRSPEKKMPNAAFKDKMQTTITNVFKHNIFGMSYLHSIRRVLVKVKG